MLFERSPRGEKSNAKPLRGWKLSTLAEGPLTWNTWNGFSGETCHKCGP